MGERDAAGTRQRAVRGVGGEDEDRVAARVGDVEPIAAGHDVGGARPGGELGEAAQRARVMERERALPGGDDGKSAVEVGRDEPTGVDGRGQRPARTAAVEGDHGGGTGIGDEGPAEDERGARRALAGRGPQRRLDRQRAPAGLGWDEEDRRRGRGRAGAARAGRDRDALSDPAGPRAEEDQAARVVDRHGEDVGIWVGGDGVGQRADTDHAAGRVDAEGGRAGRLGRGGKRRRGRCGCRRAAADRARGQRRDKEEDDDAQPAAHPPRVARHEASRSPTTAIEGRSMSRSDPKIVPRRRVWGSVACWRACLRF